MNSKQIWVVLVGIIIGVAISANVLVVPEQFMALQAQAMSGAGNDQGGW